MKKSLAAIFVLLMASAAFAQNALLPQHAIPISPGPGKSGAPNALGPGSTSGLPLISGDSSTDPSIGTRSGNTSQYVTLSGAATSGKCAQFDASGNIVATASACGGSGSPGGSDTQVQYNSSGSFGGSSNLTWVSPALTIGVAGAATGQLKLTGSTSGTVTVSPQATAGTATFTLPNTSGTPAISVPSPLSLSATTGAATWSGLTSGGVLYASGTTSVGSSAALTANAPVIGGGAGVAPTTGTRSGNTTEFATVSGALTSGNCLKSDASGNIVDNGSTCGSGGSPGGSNTQVQFNNSGSFGGSANLTWVSPALTIGAAGSTTGQLKLTGSTSGTVTISGQATAGTPTVTWGTSTGTPAVTASAPLAINTTTGNISVTGAAGQVLAGSTPAFTATPTLGASGTLGSLTLGNATSGTLTLQTVTGALGTVTVSLPAATDTLVGKATTDTLTNKTIDTAGPNTIKVNGNTLSATSGTATVTVPNSTTTLVGRNTTDTLTNKTIDTAGPNTIKINGNTLSATAGTATITVPNATSTLASLGIEDQTLAGGANVTAKSQSTGNITVDCGARPLQYITNGGAYTITAPSNDGSCILLVTNNASAGATTFSGFSVGSNTGDALTTTNTSKFSIFIWRINATSGYRIAAHQ